MAAQKFPAAGRTADGAKDVVQADTLSTPEDGTSNGTFQRFGDLTARIVA